MQLFKWTGLAGGLAGFFLLLLLPAPEGLSPEGWKVLVTGLLMAVWWITEAVPIAVTALIPIVAFPLMSLGDVEAAASGFTSDAIFLTLGGFMIGIALERWKLHLRIALNTMKLVGSEPRRVIGGFMLATALLSMWITNTATTVMMMPIALSVAMLLMEREEGEKQARDNFGTALMIGLAYAASIGGMMTLVGTSTNVMFKGYFEQAYGYSIDFLDWMKIAVPIGLSLLVATWWCLTYVMFPCALPASEEVHCIIDQRLEELGNMSAGERRTLGVFLLTASLWIGKDLIAAYVFPMLHLEDASIAIFGAALLFILPAGNGEKGRTLLEWKDTGKVPWGILILLGGGISFADYMQATGVADWLGGHMSVFEYLPVWALVLLTALMITLLTEMMSNVATLTAFLPVIIAVALAFGENPLIFAVPAAFAASCAFMLPIATPPNAVVFGSGLIRISQMVKAGLVLDIIGLGVIGLLCYALLPAVFGVEYGVLPPWATGEAFAN